MRPSQYGFYRTQWRRWPDQGVTPVSAEEAATPAPPAKSLVPSADEESPRSPGGEAAPNDMQAAEGTPPSAQPVAPTRDAGALPADPIPENPAGEDAGRPDGGGRAGSEQDGRMSRQPSAEQSMPPQPESAVRRADQSSVPGEEAERLIEAGPLRLRYPAQVGRSLAAGAVPWRLQPAAPQ